MQIPDNALNVRTAVWMYTLCWVSKHRSTVAMKVESIRIAFASSWTDQTEYTIPN